MRFLSGLSMAGILLFSSVIASADVLFTDNTFNLAQYTLTPTYLSTVGVTIVGSQCTSCGNPGDALQIVANLPNGQPSTLDQGIQGFVNNTFSYDPSTQGAINSINASVDKNLALNIADSDFPSSFRPLIEQDGNFYLAGISGPMLVTGAGGGSTGFNTISGTLTAADFQQFDFSTGAFNALSHPNFAGDQMLFGLAQSSGLQGSPAATVTATYDNLSLDIVTTPEPSGAGIAVVILFFAYTRIRARRTIG